MSWRVVVCTVASFLVITLPTLAPPSTTPSMRTPSDQSSSPINVAEQELIRKLQEAGYTAVARCTKPSGHHARDDMREQAIPGNEMTLQ